MIKSSKPKSGSADELMERATAALQQGAYFECERLATKAMQTAFSRHDFESVARISLPLQEARRQRRLQAVDAKYLEVYDEQLPGADDKLHPGCIIICDPSVGADARRLAERAIEEKIPLIAIACEPLTQEGLLPVVVVGPSTIRAKLRPPKSFTPAWCLEAIEALSASALQSFDPGRAPHRQVEDLLNKCNTLPESEDLHQKLAQIAMLAAKTSSTTPPR
jgi:hypothetical protein